MKFQWVILFILLSGCASLMHKRSFIDEMDRNSDGLFVPGRDFAIIPGDSGNPYRSNKEIMARTPASQRDIKRQLWDKSIQQELYEKEKNLNNMERREYLQHKSYMRDRSERIYYLGLSPRERVEYIRSRPELQTSTGQAVARVYKPSGNFSRNELLLGMDKSAVIRRWGRPSRVDIAGDPRNQNERWSFYHGGTLKQIFFEGGLVNGWILE